MISAIQRLIFSALLIISTNVQAEVASYFDESLASERRVELLMNEKTLDEKIG